MRRRVAARALAGLLLVLASLPGAASAAPVALEAEGNLEGIACPSTAQCTAVDSGGQELTFDPLAPGEPRPTRIDAGDSSEEGHSFGQVPLACPTITQCTAVDAKGYEVTFDPVSPASGGLVLIDAGSGSQSLACPIAVRCVDVDSRGRAVIFDPRAPEDATRITLDSGFELEGVACPSNTQCSAVDSGGRELTFNPASPGSVAPVRIDRHPLSTVVCASVSRCVALGESGHAVSFDPLSTESPTVSRLDADGLACPSASQCTAAGGGGEYFTFNPSSRGPFAGKTLDIITLTAVACPSPRQCTAIDFLGRELTFDPSVPAISKGRLRGVSERAAKLSFTLTAGTSDTPLKSITIRLRHGLILSRSARSLAAGIMVTGNRRRLAFTTTIAHGTLAIALHAPVPRVHVRISFPALAVTRALAEGVTTETVRALTVNVGATATVGPTTRFALSFDLAARRPLHLGIGPHARARLLEIAKREAARNGEHDPYDIQAVRTTVGLVDRLTRTGSGPRRNEPAYYVALRGSFTCRRCSRPPGMRSPSGSVVTLELPVALGQDGWRGFGLSDRYPPLRRLGVPVVLRP
jgi:hypothetical protein